MKQIVLCIILIIQVCVYASQPGQSLPLAKPTPKKLTPSKAQFCITAKIDIPKKPTPVYSKTEPSLLSATILLQKLSAESAFTQIHFFKDNVLITERIEKDITLSALINDSSKASIKLSLEQKKRFYTVKKGAIKLAKKLNSYNHWLTVVSYYNDGTFRVSTHAGLK